MHYAPKPRIAVQGSAKHRSRPEIPGGTSASGLIAAVQFLEAAGGRRPTTALEAHDNRMTAFTIFGHWRDIMGAEDPTGLSVAALLDQG
jgi:hypothetical protein